MPARSVIVAPHGGGPQPAGLPTYSPGAGTYPASQTVTINCATPAPSIYYTTDGTIPTIPATGSTQLYAGPITVSANETLKAVAIAPGFFMSSVSSSAYLIQASVPTFSPVAGSYTATQSVTISSSSPSPSIYYTTDGSTPTFPVTGTTQTYTGPVSVAASETLKAIATSAGLAPSGVGSAAYTIGAAATTMLGANLGDLGYFKSEMPWLNVLKSGGAITAGYNTVQWRSEDATSAETTEEGYIQVDLDGYPTSLTTSLGGAQKFTQLRFWIYLNVNGGAISPGATYLYPPGPYTLQGSGAGTITVGNDVTSLGVPTGAGVTVSGLTITSTSTSGTWSVPLNCGTPSANGMFLLLKATDPLHTGNYIRNLSQVQTSLLASFNGGEQFHPTFLATMAGLPSVRFMKPLEVEVTEGGITLLGAPPLHAVTAALGGPWQAPNLTAPMYFSAGEWRQVTFTLGSATITWSTPLTQSTNTTETYFLPWPNSSAFSGRQRTTSLSYASRRGWPWESICALAAKLNLTSVHVNTPLMAGGVDPTIFDPTVYITPMNTFLQANLPSTCTAIIELSNETWNGVYKCRYLAQFAGKILWPTQTTSGDFQANRNWYGMRAALQAQQCLTDWGANSARCIPLMGFQSGNTGTLNQSMDTAFWFNASAKRASQYGPNGTIPSLKAGTAHGYWSMQDNGFLSAATVNKMIAQPDGGIAAVFGLANSNLLPDGTTATFANGTSLPSNGYIGQWTGRKNADLAACTSYGLPYQSYESGPGHLNGGGNAAGYPNMISLASRDARAGTEVLANLNWWKANVGTGILHLWQYFQLCYPNDSANAFGALESTMQPISPKSAAPPKYQALLTFMGF